jgi:XTP/dITP diphosphohydrolase
MTPTFLLATRNAHKAAEIRAILGARSRCLTMADFPGAPAVVEDAPTFAGNATKKAVQLAQWLAISAAASALPAPAFVLADDSGLEVDVLNGAPGVLSARFAAIDNQRPDNSSDADNNAKLIRLLQAVPVEKRTARFRCVLALAPTQKARSSPLPANDAELGTRIFEGACEGRIILEPRGRNGFGYDPLFVPEGFDKTYAEIGEDAKNRISHRARALAKLRDWLDALV